MKIKAIFNRDGGTFRTTDMDAYSKKAEDVFRAAGHDIEIAVASGDGMADILERTARRDDLDAMLAGGGDGTISAAAGVAWKNGMPLGVVPAGTMNLFARALKLPLDIWKVLDVLAEGRIIEADIGSADGRAFVHQFSMGLHARMVRYRESYSFASRLGKIRASTRAALGVMFNPPEFEIEFEVDGVRETRKVSAILGLQQSLRAECADVCRRSHGRTSGLLHSTALEAAWGRKADVRYPARKIPREPADHRDERDRRGPAFSARTP